jgi:hypothetical protein
MNRKYAALIIWFLFVPTIIVAIFPIQYGKVTGTITDVKQITVLSNKISGFKRMTGWQGYHHPFFLEYDNLTTPEGSPAAVGCVNAFGYVYPYGTIISPKLPSMLGFYLENWSASYAFSGGSWLFYHDYSGEIDLIIWYEPYYEITVTISHTLTSWSEIHIVNQSVYDTLIPCGTFDVFSSRPRADCQMWAFITWIIGWIVLVGTVISVLRTRRLEDE